jgi:hypothetical protein
MRTACFTLIGTIALTLLAAPAGATFLNTYTDRTAWTTAAGAPLTIDFNGLASTTSPYTTEYLAGITVEGVTFISFDGEGKANLFAYGAASAAGNWGSGDYLRGGYAPGYLLATISGAGSTAIGFDLMSFAAGKTIQVTFTGGEVRSIATSAAPNLAFFGVISDTPITSVQFSGNGGFTLLDNFSYLETEETPEAGTMLLGGAGLALLAAARRLRRRV